MTLLFLAGCNSMSVPAMQPTALDFGDSNSLGMSGPARLYLFGRVDYRHDNWDDGNIPPSDTPWFYGDVQKKGLNNGYTSTMLDAMQKQLTDGKFYTVILFNSGLHDMQYSPKNNGPNIPPDEYRTNLETIAALVEKHATYVIWVDTNVVQPDALGPFTPAGFQTTYNAIAHDVAREHGFYIFVTPSEDEQPGGIHFTGRGYKNYGSLIGQCVLTVLGGGEDAYCHR